MHQAVAVDKMSSHRWVVCVLLFLSTTILYLDRQVLSLTWKDFIAPQYHWSNSDYGTITAVFSLAYAIFMLFAGRFVDWMDTKKGYLWCIFVWSIAACLHAFCGIATAGIVTGQWGVGFRAAEEVLAGVSDVAKVANVSVALFIFVRIALAFGQSGNFPACIKATAEYFPKKDRAYATSLFNTGATVGALLAPLSIPFIARAWGWEIAFLVVGVTGFIWMTLWRVFYDKPHRHPKVNRAELLYIQQDDEEGSVREVVEVGTLPREIVVTPGKGAGITFRQAFRYKQTWAFAVGKFMSDGVWWFFMFWMPAYLSSVYGLDSTQSAPQIFVLYTITFLSIAGGYLPTYFVDKKGMNPYDGRMRSMLIFAFFPLLTLLAQPLGGYSVWLPVIIIGIAGAAHQAWSANIFSTIGDMFPKHAIGTITGIGGMAGGIGSFLINIGSGTLFDYADRSQMQFLGFSGIQSGYFIIFIICSLVYLVGWLIMKSLVPTYSPITDL